MSNRVLMLRSIISCCLIFLFSGCETEQNNGGQGKKASNDKVDVAIEVETGNIPALPPIPIAPAPAPILPPIPVPFGDGNGGGSQGALKPIDLGNSDDAEDVIPFPVCGNGRQEAYSGNPNCPFNMYGVAIVDEGGTSNLIGFQFDNDGEGGLIGQIGPGVRNVTDIEFSPEGELIGLGQNINNNEWVTFTIDCRTGEITSGLRPSGLLSPLRITDLSFDSFGRLFAYVVGSLIQTVYVVNPITGQFVPMPSITGLNDPNNAGLGAAPFPIDGLYVAGTLNLSIIDRSYTLIGGSAFITQFLTFFPPATSLSQVNGLDVDPITQLFYASINNNGTNYVGLMDLGSGNVGFITTPPLLAPFGLNGLAVNRRYEECDTLSGDPVLPEGSGCTEDCFFIETDCTDGFDNDLDTLIDCADPDCLGQTCDDDNLCVINEVCTPEGICQGIQNPCDDGNECTTNACAQVIGCLYLFDTDKTSPGSCTPFGNCEGDLPTILDRDADGVCPPEDVIDQCLLGFCVQGEGIFCQGVEAEFVTGEVGCNDGNDCTADDCLDGECINAAMNNTPCFGDDGPGTCDQGTCIENDLVIANWKMGH